MSGPGYTEILTAMQERYQSLTGFHPDSASDIGIRLQILAWQLAKLGEDMALLREQVFPRTSTGEALEMHAETRGLTRKPALHGEGRLRFLRESVSPNDITIPAGVLCTNSAEPRMQFETTEAALLPAGELSATAPARAVEAGAGGNTGVGSVSLMVTSVPGISGVSNPVPFTGGADAESDDALRERLLRSFANLSNGANAAFYYDIAMAHEGVASALVLPRNRGRGTVDVVVACRSEEYSEQQRVMAELLEDMEAQKEINVDVLVVAAKKEAAEINAKIAVEEGYDFEVLRTQCEAAIVRYAYSLPVGAALLCARIGQAILGVEGVYNYSLSFPYADIIPGRSNVIRSARITIGEMAVDGNA